MAVRVQLLSGRATDDDCDDSVPEPIVRRADHRGRVEHIPLA